MGKRKHKSKDRDYEHLLHKITKLEKVIKRHRHDDLVQSPNNMKDASPVDDDYSVSVTEEDIHHVETVRSTVHIPEQSTKPANPLCSLSSPTASGMPPPRAPTQTSVQQTVPPTFSVQNVPLSDTREVLPTQPVETSEETGDVILDSTLLEILGEDPSLIQQYGKEIQNDLAKRLQHITTNGLTKEVRKELCDRYLPPSNCPLIDAPELNPEIIAAVSDAVMKRDKGIQLKQKQLGRAISCVAEALSTLMSKEDKDAPVIKLLMDACRLLSDNQNQDSVTRRNFILYNLKKDTKEQLQKTNIDKMLFGSELAETLKTAKSISKSGADLKPPASSNKVSGPKNKPYTPQQYTGAQPKRNNLNWKAPPLNRRHQGSQRSREPASSRNQHASSSRTSYRAARYRYSSRH
ncbi:uncharacterized protein LOC134742302 [Cydia strobilella]|uniref:uncharacterized protein LOC134742302 n=1 Tax=Cydia strobilella TaxID=1100964 RepID=UPI003007C4D3